MASQGPMAGWLDDDHNVIPCYGALLRHIEIHNERNAENHGVPPMPIRAEDIGSGWYLLGFEGTGFQQKTFSEAWTTVNDLAVGWRYGYTRGVLNS